MEHCDHCGEELHYLGPVTTKEGINLNLYSCNHCDGENSMDDEVRQPIFDPGSDDPEDEPLFYEDVGELAYLVIDHEDTSSVRLELLYGLDGIFMDASDARELAASLIRAAEVLES